MSYHVAQTSFKTLPDRIIVRENGYMSAKQDGVPITEYVYVLQAKKIHDKKVAKR